MPFKGFVAERNFYIFSLWNETTWMNIVRLFMLIFDNHLNINDCLLCQQCQLLETNFCLLSIWTTFYQGLMWCMVISINITPSSGDVEAQHFSQQKVIKKKKFCLSILWHVLLISLWINQFHHVACLYVFVWYNVFFFLFVR